MFSFSGYLLHLTERSCGSWHGLPVGKNAAGTLHGRKYYRLRRLRLWRRSPMDLAEQGRYLDSNCMSQNFSPATNVRLLAAVTLLINFSSVPI
jgi:hypothetical protein